MNRLSLEACLALRDLGYPQDVGPYYVRWRGEWIGKDRPVAVSWPVENSYADEHAAQPDPLDALDWLERERGWYWSRDIPVSIDGEGEAQWAAFKWDTYDAVEAPDPSALILAIAEHHRQ